MTTAASKIAVSLPTALIASAKAAVKRGDAASVSAYVADALTEKCKHDDLAQLLTEMLAETGGPLSQEELDAASRKIGAPPKARKRRR